jgi:hypothetical protein
MTKKDCRIKCVHIEEEKDFYTRKRRPRTNVLPLYASIDVIENPSMVNQDAWNGSHNGVVLEIYIELLIIYNGVIHTPKNIRGGRQFLSQAKIV